MQVLLVDLDAAAAWSGRPASTLCRWIHEGRLSRYGTARRALVDLREVPEKSVGGVPPQRPTCRSRAESTT